MTTTFKHCTPNDLLTLQALSRQTYSDTFAHQNTPANLETYLEQAYNLDQLRSELLNCHSFFYFLRMDGVLAGYIKCNEFPEQTDINDPNALELQRIYVAKEFQGKGCGSALLQKAIDLASEREKEYLWLGVWEKNEKALQFYQRNGFYEIGKHAFIMGDEEQTDLILRKDL